MKFKIVSKRRILVDKVFGNIGYLPVSFVVGKLVQ
jgi:hypothetical protein